MFVGARAESKRSETAKRAVQCGRRRALLPPVSEFSFMQKLISGNRLRTSAPPRFYSPSPLLLYQPTPGGPIPPLNLRNPLEKGEKGPRLLRVFRPEERGRNYTKMAFNSSPGRRRPASPARKRKSPGGGKKSGLGNWTVFSRAAMLRNGAALSAWNEKFPQRNLKLRAVPSS